MSFNEVMAELPALTVSERQLLIRRALELDEPSFSPDDEAEIEKRSAAHRADPTTSVTLDEMKSRIRSLI